MSTTTRSYTIRLSAAGKQQLEADLKALGQSSEQSLKRIQSAGRPASAGLRETDGAARQLKGALYAMGQGLAAVQRLARFMGTTALAGAGGLRQGRARRGASVPDDDATERGGDAGQLGAGA
ncbi:hypothetical protein [Salipiger pallidus]|uniref:hypothetical protein n=1 Tax=Salipiger pallidus TaxID=1775170 RepID=UPI00166BAE1F|nr:hypothetical protein [Salipiger pallidus]